MPGLVTFIQLNEFYFDALEAYDIPGKYPNLSHVVSNLQKTSSEKAYEELEPWIQWPSIYSGLTASEHKLKRLGDKGHEKIEWLHDFIERKAKSYVVLAPMNCDANLTNPKNIFVPDPWSGAVSSSHWAARTTTALLKQAVIENSTKRLSPASILALVFLFLKFVRVKNYAKFALLLFKSLKFRWFRALFLDLLINEIHVALISRENPDYSSVFFNSFAHIQHHYMRNSKLASSLYRRNPEPVCKNNCDPFEDSLRVLDWILDDYFDEDKKRILILATGLSQELDQRGINYYRLENAGVFFSRFDIFPKQINYRMSRDLTLVFSNKNLANDALNILSKITVSGISLFEEFALDGNRLHFSVGFSKKLTPEMIATDQRVSTKMLGFYSFVAIKNTIHAPTGYYYCSEEIPETNKPKHITQIYQKIKSFLDESNV